MVAVSTRISAGILLHRWNDAGLEVMLAHMGGPFHRHRDIGSWTIPKGEGEPGEELVAVALREFAEETGLVLEAPRLLELGVITQKGGKLVHAWAVEGDLDPANAVSNTFVLEWPPGSGVTEVFPEIDRVAWFQPVEARRRLKASQVPFIDRLEGALGRDPDTSTSPSATDRSVDGSE